MVEEAAATKRYEDLGDCSTTTAVPGVANWNARAVQGSPSYGDLGRVTGAHSKLGVSDPGLAIFPRLSSCTDDTCLSTAVLCLESTLIKTSRLLVS